MSYLPKASCQFLLNSILSPLCIDFLHHFFLPKDDDDGDGDEDEDSEDEIENSEEEVMKNMPKLFFLLAKSYWEDENIREMTMGELSSLIAKSHKALQKSKALLLDPSESLRTLMAKAMKRVGKNDGKVCLL
jgi:hypothetical protein